MNLLDRLLELHEQKGWMREVVVEALLTFCSTLTDAGMINATLVKLRPLLEVSIKDMAAWQVCLAVGLHQLHTVSKAKVGALWQSEWRKEMASVEVGKEPLTMQSISLLKDTLLASTTGYPKVFALTRLPRCVCIGHRAALPAKSQSLLACRRPVVHGCCSRYCSAQYSSSNFITHQRSPHLISHSPITDSPRVGVPGQLHCAYGRQQRTRAHQVRANLLL
jgi:hypothetical protein